MYLKKHEGCTSSLNCSDGRKIPFAEFMVGGMINGVVFYHIIIFE